ncbi:hypothetical protein VIGAN_03258900, partial [Vigna angularis var. angularis]
TFPTSLNLKLDEENILVWQQQIIATTKGLHFLKFLDGNNVPSMLLTPANEAENIINPLFLQYEQQDQLIMA